MKQAGIAFVVLLMVFSASVFAHTPLPERGPDYPESLNCWSCEVTNGVTTWFERASSQRIAKARSIASCRNGSRGAARACGSAKCSPDVAYTATCDQSNVWARNPENVYIPPTRPTNPVGRTCTTNYECSSYQVCTRGECVAKNGYDNRCSTNMDCAFPNECLNGKCGQVGRDGCKADYQCGALHQCERGECVRMDRPGGRCYVDRDCPVFHSCKAGMCSRN